MIKKLRKNKIEEISRENFAQKITLYAMISPLHFTDTLI